MLPTRPSHKEEKYVDFDTENMLWGIFGVDSGFCYSTHCSETEANDRADKNKTCRWCQKQTSNTSGFCSDNCAGKHVEDVVDWQLSNFGR